MPSPFKLTQIYQALTAKNPLLKKKLKLGTSEIPIPPKRQDVLDTEVINRFNKANPRVDTTEFTPFLKQSNEPDMQVKDDGFLDEALGDYNNYLGMRKARPPKKRYKEIPFKKFLGEYSKENRADGGRIGYNQGSIPGEQGSMGPVYTTNKIEDAAKEVVKRLIKLDGVNIPLTDKISMSLGPDLDQTEIRGVIDILGGELNFGGGFKGDDKGIGFNFRKEFQNGGMLVQPSDDGSRPGYKGSLTKKQQQKVIEAFPNDVFDFDTYPMSGAKKYLTSDQNKANPIHTKVDRFRKKGFTLEMGKGLNTRGVPYSKEGKRLSIKDQNKIKAKYDLPEGIKEWDFKTYKYGIKSGGRENLLSRMARTLAEKGKWTLAADFGGAKGWMMAQMQRVFKNESKNPNIKKLTYKPVYAEINGQERIVGFKDNTVAGKGKTYYGLAKYTKKGAGDWTQHGDWKLNNKLIDISKRAKKAPNEVIIGLLQDKNFKTKNLQLSHLIHFLSGTEATSKAILKNAVVRHHNSGVKFGSATNDITLTTSIINKRIVEAESRIAAGSALAEDVQLLRNNNVYVRGADNKLYGAGKKSPIGQFKQIESSVVNALETGVDFKGNKFKMADLKRYVAALGGGACSVFNGKKADGGRIGLATGTPNIDDCYKSGTAVINSGKVPIDKADDFAQVLKRAGSLGKNIMKFGIIPEAMYVAADSLVRLGMGNTFKEAGLLASDYLLPGDQAKASEMSKVKRFFGDETGELVGRVIDYKNQLAKIQSLEGQVSNLDNLSDVGEFDYIGDLSGESNTKKNLLSQARNDLNNKFKITEAEQLYAESKQEDAYDASSATSFLSNLKRKYRDSSDNLSDVETLAAPEKTQMQLNLDMLPAVPKEFMMATDDALRNYVRAESVRSGEKLNPQLYIDEKEKLKKEFMTKGPGVYGKEQVYGTQGIFGGEPVDMTNYQPSNRFGSGFQQRPVLYPQGRNPLGLASGGLAGLIKKYND